MRAVQAYININNRSTCAYNSTNIVDILVWKLSLIRNKKLGFQTVLYTRKEDLTFLENNDLARLYDEINFINPQKLQNINIFIFWACVKFIAIEEEIIKGHQFFIMDTDLVFMNATILAKLQDCKNLFWLNKEPACNYPNLKILKKPKDFKYPYYFAAQTRPFNTAIIKIENEEIYKEWLRVAWRFITNNPAWEIERKTGQYGQMVTVEQRFLPNVLINKFHEKPEFFCDNGIGNFGKEHFHTWGAKEPINGVVEFRRRWIKSLLLIIKKEDEKEYRKLILEDRFSIKDVLANWSKIDEEKILAIYLN